MKKKSIIILIIVILILIVVGLFIFNLPKERPIEPIPTVEPIETEEETIVEETTTDKSDPSIPTFNAKQGTVEGYEATETEETEVLTGAEIDIDNIEYEDISLPEEVSQITRGISNYAGTTSKHGYKYPADYVENSGNSVADTERMFDEGFFSEEEYQEMIEFARELDSGSFEQSIQDEANSDNSNSGGGTVPGSSGAPIPLPDDGVTYEPDGRICY